MSWVRSPPTSPVFHLKSTRGVCGTSAGGAACPARKEEAGTALEGQYIDDGLDSTVVREPGIQRHPAVYEYRRTGYIVSGIGREPNSGGRNVLRLSNPVVRDEPHQLLQRFWVGPDAFVNRRPDRSGCQRVDPDALRSQLLRD